MNTYFIKYQVLDTKQSHFEFAGWPFRFAVIQDVNKELAESALIKSVEYMEEFKSAECRIDSTIECLEPLTFLPITIEQNTVVDSKGKRRCKDIIKS